MPASKFGTIKGRVFGKLTVLTEAVDGKCLCQCSCGRTKWIARYSLISGKTSSCGICNRIEKQLNDITGKQFGEWTVLKYVDNGNWLCRCSCGTEKVVEGKQLRDGKSKSCGHNRLIDLTGQKFGLWTVLKHEGYGKWLCRCECGTERVLEGAALRRGLTKSCGCASKNRFIDLTGKKFGEWTVLEYAGNQMWKCQCSCEAKTIKLVAGQSLRDGSSKSCGCKSAEKTKETLLQRYGDTNVARLDNPRKDWQIKALESREDLIGVIKTLGQKPSMIELANALNVQPLTALRAVHKHSLEEYTTIYENESQGERDIYNLIYQLRPETTIIRRARILQNNKELDIYIPEFKLAIEFNGVYWHSDEFKDKRYHQDKTIECAKRGIRLIHVFEHEWEDQFTRIKIINLIKSALNINKNVVYGRQLDIIEEKSKEAEELLKSSHLQNNINSQVSIVAKLNNEVVGVMTFGVPRFDRSEDAAEWELLRLVWKPGLQVVGGTERLFSFFIKTYNPNSILTYCDISKFTGNIYTKLGFKCTPNDLTSPNYTWVKVGGNEDGNRYKVLNRYQTMKAKLLDRGYGEFGNTEAEIMHNLGYLRIYDCGNLKLIWTNQR